MKYYKLTPIGIVKNLNIEERVKLSDFNRYNIYFSEDENLSIMDILAHFDFYNTISIGKIRKGLAVLLNIKIKYDSYQGLEVKIKRSKKKDLDDIHHIFIRTVSEMDFDISDENYYTEVTRKEYMNNKIKNTFK